MKTVEQEYDVGVIVGRFQVPELHAAHRDLIQHVCDLHGKVLIFLGLSPVLGTRENPLDFEARKQMILDAFPGVNVLYIADRYSDDVWSTDLDRQVERLLTPSQTAVVYGGRDSFISRYSGKLPVLELEQTQWVSGSEYRREVSKRSVKSTSSFRAGVVWGAFNRFPTVFTTVDVAILNEDESSMLLCRKADEPHYRFIGGFSDPQLGSFEADARREVMEEAGISITDPIYVGSYMIDDWRYRNEVDVIRTVFFKAKYQFGRPRPGDDVAEVCWLPAMTHRSSMMPTHHELLSVLQQNLHV